MLSQILKASCWNIGIWFCIIISAPFFFKSQICQNHKADKDNQIKPYAETIHHISVRIDETFAIRRVPIKHIRMRNVFFYPIKSDQAQSCISDQVRKSNLFEKQRTIKANRSHAKKNRCGQKPIG